MQSAIFKHLLGSWNFERSISKPALHIKGIATFEELEDNILSYHESGTYTVDEISYDFFQKRIFSYDKNALCIYKNDNSLLHKFDFENQYTPYPITLNHIHLCGPDSYNCTLILKTELYFEMLYTIIGENKNYEIRTQYIKD